MDSLIQTETWDPFEYLEDESETEDLGVFTDKPPPHILFIDDDPLFRAQVREVARKRNLPITICSSLHEMEIMADSRVFDIAIIDYYLDDIRAYLRGTDIANGRFLRRLSNTERIFGDSRELEGSAAPPYRR